MADGGEGRPPTQTDRVERGEGVAGGVGLPESGHSRVGRTRTGTTTRDRRDLWDDRRDGQGGPRGVGVVSGTRVSLPSPEGPEGSRGYWNR